MKALKILGYILLVLVGIYLVAAIVAPTSMKVEKSIVINAPAATVFDQVNCFPAWHAWSPFEADDPTNTNEYSENPCGQGAWNSWKGDKTGSGKQDIVEVRDNEYIKTSLVFDGDPTPQTSEWFFEETEEGTKVSWNFIGSKVPFYLRPMNFMGNMMLDKYYGIGLANLKEVAEAAPAVEEPAYEVQTIDLPATHYLLVSGDVKPMDIGLFYTENFLKIMEYAEEAGAEVIGQPSGLYFNWTDTLAKMAAAIPVDREVEGNDEIEFRSIEACKALLIDYYGAYDEVGPAHYAIEDFSNANEVNLAGFAIETYITDPEEEPDTSKWLTKIIYPIAAATE